MVVGSKLKKLRENRGLNQQELGNILGVTKASICCYEKETRNPTLKNIIDLSDYFDVSINYLLGLDDLIKIKHRKEYISKEEMKFLKLLRKNPKIYEQIKKEPSVIINKMKDF